ncbi:hypothetical protein MHYP_G00360210 [Metynnis hypsauchen]
MSQNIYDDVISIEELNRGQRAEVEVVIYESADTVRRHDPNTEMEATNSKSNPEIINTGSGFRGNPMIMQERRTVLYLAIKVLDLNVYQPGLIFPVIILQLESLFGDVHCPGRHADRLQRDQLIPGVNKAAMLHRRGGQGE